MDEEIVEVDHKYELGCICTCSYTHVSSEAVEIPPRKQFILSTVSRTESYLRERRIPELIRYLFTKIIAEAPDKPICYLEKLLNECMLFRAGHGPAPVIFEKRHLEAVVKSFDPGNRRWLSMGQVRRLYSTLGLTFGGFEEQYVERYPCEMVLEKVKKTQERELFELLSSGMIMNTFDDFPTSDTSDIP